MIYDTCLRVAPFILGPGGRTRKESTVLLGPKELSVQEDEFTQTILSPIRRLRGRLPVAAELVRFSQVLVAVNVLRNRTVQIGQNRSGLSLIYGVCFRTSAVREYPHMLRSGVARLHVFLRDEFGLHSSQPDLEPVILRLQQDIDPDEVLSESKVEVLLADFERDYGLAAQSIFERGRLWSYPFLPPALRKHVGHVSTYGTVDATLEHWKRVEAPFAISRQPQLGETRVPSKIEHPSHRREIFMRATTVASLLGILAITFLLSQRWVPTFYADDVVSRVAYKTFFVSLTSSLFFLNILLHTWEKVKKPRAEWIYSLVRMAPFTCLWIASAAFLIMVLLAPC